MHINTQSLYAVGLVTTFTNLISLLGMNRINVELKTKSV